MSKTVESPTRIEPCHLEAIPAALGDLVAEISGAAAELGARLHPRTAAGLASLVRIMNTYYSNLIEGHNTVPRDIERALGGELSSEGERRNLQLEATAHVRVQAEVERRFIAGELREPASIDFVRWLHRAFYQGAAESMLLIGEGERQFRMVPGAFRNDSGHDVSVGRHVPPASGRVDAFMRHFADRYRFESLGKGQRIIAMAAAHHRLNYVHPFADGNGRVSRLVSHAMGLAAGVGAHGLWSISRGLARGLESRGEYKRMMDHADMPRQGDLDGRGNLSQGALTDFVAWFLRVALDQVRFMATLFDLDGLQVRLGEYVQRDPALRPEAAAVLHQVLLAGELPRGLATAVTGLPERTGRDVLRSLLARGILASDTPKGPVRLKFSVDDAEILFPRLYPQS